MYKSDFALKGCRLYNGYNQWELVFANDIRLHAGAGYFQIILGDTENKNREE